MRAKRAILRSSVLYLLRQVKLY